MSLLKWLISGATAWAYNALLILGTISNTLQQKNTSLIENKISVMLKNQNTISYLDQYMAPKKNTLDGSAPTTTNACYERSEVSQRWSIYLLRWTNQALIFYFDTKVKSQNGIHFDF